jgi:hypothetical protein
LAPARKSARVHSWGRPISLSSSNLAGLYIRLNHTRSLTALTPLMPGFAMRRAIAGS